MGTVPPGTIISYGLPNADLNALQQQGWWVCDGRTVTDPAATVLRNQPTPNLMLAADQWRLGRHLVGAGSVGVGQATGNALSRIPDLDVRVETSGWDDTQRRNADPRLLIYSAEGWVDGSPIVSTGRASTVNARIVIEPPSYTVLYLILVK